MDNYKMIDLAVKLNNNKIGTLTPAITPAKISESADKDDNDKILYEKINQIESNIRKNKFETGVAIDEKGNIIINKRGQQYSISFTNEEIAKIKNTIFTHNHPSGLQYEDKSIRRTGNSFSWEDINLAIKSNVKEIRAVTPVLTFSMKRPANGWPDLEKAKALFISQNATVKNNYMKYVEKLNYSEQAIARAETMHFHTVWKEWVKSFKKMGIDIEYTNRRTL
jgi:hypothetical protein